MSQGPQGFQGPTGLQGPQGPQGNRGIQGTAGVTGPQGVQGIQGVEGIQGPTGPRGPDGAVGPTGATGMTGSAGSAGVIAGPDIPPLIANAADDEFDVGVSLDTSGTRRSGATPWTSALTNATTSLSNGRLQVTSLATASFEYVWQPVSGTDWMYTTHISHNVYDSNVAYVGMIVTDSTGSNRLALVKTLDTASRFQVLTNSTFDNVLGTFDAFSLFGPGYFQMEYRTFGAGDAGVIGRYSTNGSLFTTRLAKKPTWTPARVGYLIGVSGTATIGLQLTSDWFRRNTGYTPLESLPVAVFTTTGPVSVSGTTYTFTGSGTFTVNNASAIIDTLVVGGGGAGSSGFFGGGGGGGGLQYATGVVVQPGTYTVTVGDGGVIVGGITGANGGNSSFLTYTGTGGGNGGRTWAGTVAAGNGGCGGGGGYQDQVGGIGSQGGNGARGVQVGSRHGGGGGGMGGNASAQNGGPGIVNSITGTATFYAGGGAGGPEGALVATGGSGGGGNPGTTGTANRGGGGGGAIPPDTLPGRGGSGVVIIRVV